MELKDLSDERRSDKPWLPQNGGLDVSDGLVVADQWGKPACVRHGAMNRIRQDRRQYRCLAVRCGVGAELWN